LSALIPRNWTASLSDLTNSVALKNFAEIRFAHDTLLGAILWGYPRQDEPFTLGELGERIGLPRTTISRHLRYLGDFERHGVKGCGWVKVSDY